MDKEMEFKNKSIKEKVNGSFEMIIVLSVSYTHLRAHET